MTFSAQPQGNRWIDLAARTRPPGGVGNDRCDGPMQRTDGSVQDEGSQQKTDVKDQKERHPPRKANMPGPIVTAPTRPVGRAPQTLFGIVNACRHRRFNIQSRQHG